MGRAPGALRRPCLPSLWVGVSWIGAMWMGVGACTAATPAEAAGPNPRGVEAVWLDMAGLDAAWLAMAIAVGAASAWGLHVRMNRLRRRHARELEEQKRELARQSSQARAQMFAALAQELRTPMTGVIGMGELLLATPLNPQQRACISALRGAGEDLLRLLEDAQDQVRVEAGQLIPADQFFDLHGLVDELDALSAPLAKQRGVALQLAMGDGVPRYVRGDAARVRRILLKLLAHTLRFAECGRVALSVSKPEAEGLCFEVSDEGPGLTPEEKARLFRRHVQEGAPNLTLCRELAVAMRGSLDVDSVPGAGTKFTVRLPLPESVPPTREDGTPLPAFAVQQSLSLLLVEDEPMLADVLAGLLRLQGHHVVHVPHSLSALAAVVATPFDAVLIDLDLPGIDGLALARQLRIQGFARPLFAVTARCDAVSEATGAGFDHFLAKPMTPRMLSAALQAIDPAKPLRSLEEPNVPVDQETSA